MNYESIVNKDNDSKVYLCKLKDGRILQLQVHDTCEFADKAVYVLYNFEDQEDLKEYLACDVEEVLELIEFDWYEEHEDSFDNMDFKSIEKYLIDADVWQYLNTEELNEILKALDQPLVEGGGLDEKDKQEYLNPLDKGYGIVFYWSEYDDFSCYGDGFTHYIKVISGVKKI